MYQTTKNTLPRLTDRQRQLVEQYAHLPRQVVRKRFRGKHLLDEEEMIDIGVSALIRAVVSYDLERGVPFVSFAVWTLTNAILDELRRSCAARERLRLDKRGWVNITRNLVAKRTSSPDRIAATRSVLESIRHGMADEDSELLYDHYDCGVRPRELAGLRDVHTGDTQAPTASAGTCAPEIAKRGMTPASCTKTPRPALSSRGGPFAFVASRRNDHRRGQY